MAGHAHRRAAHRGRAPTGAFVGTFVWQNIDSGGSHGWLMIAAVYTSLIATVGGFIQNALR